MPKGCPGYCIYTAQGGDTLVKQTRRSIYFDYKVEALYGTVDTYIHEVEWIPVAKWFNTTSTSTTYHQPITSRLFVTEGQKLANAVDIPAIFNGLSLTFDGEFKTFRSEETIAPSTTTVDIDVKPGTYTTLYQKRWKFKNHVWFTNDHSNTFYTVEYGDKVLEVPVDVYVDGCEYILYQDVLPDLSSRGAKVVGIQQAYTQTNPQKFEDTTDKCRKTIMELKN